MAGMTPQQEAEYALDYGVNRDDLGPEARAAYDQLAASRAAAKAAAAAAEPGGPGPGPGYGPGYPGFAPGPGGPGFPPSPGYPGFPPPPVGPSTPEIRAQILQQLKSMDPRFGLPFLGRGLAPGYGPVWDTYGSVVLQMAILETLLSIERILSGQPGGNSQGQPGPGPVGQPGVPPAPPG